MSCQVKLNANISDILNVRRYLFPWDDDRGSENWLHNCLVSVSPTGEIIALANGNRIVVLSAKWDSNAILSQYHISFNGTLDSVQITSLLCLPIASQSQNSQVGPDWTCIVTGLQSGEVKFYTENCNLLLVEQFHDEEVNSIKCQSHHPSHVQVGSDFRPEELYIQYPKCVCVLQGSQLFTTLRSARSQLARVQAKGDSSLFPSSSHILLHKKWGIYEQYEMNDVAVVGLDASNTFNHLLTASTCGGFDTRYRVMAPNNTLIVGAGAKPYVGFHYALEGGMQPLLSDVAKAVANKLKSALPGWLVGGKSAAEKTPLPTIQPAESVGCRFGLCDIRRTADSVVLSPNKKLSVVTDSLGRIALIDNYKGVAVRLWKGYRGAQCAFLQVPDEERNRQNKGTSKRRVALFLIIYTPKKGTIEIWTLQQGPKIVTFSASKFSKLLYVNYGLMGVGNGSPKSKHNNNVNVFLLDPDGKIKELIVPFHFALTEKNSKRARDVHLFKRLKQILKTEDYDTENLCSEVALTCSELKTNEIRSQCFDLLISNKNFHPKAACIMTDCLLEKLSVQDITEAETSRLIACNKNLKLISEFFMFVGDYYDDIDAENGNFVNNNEENEEEIQVNKMDTRLVIADKEMNNLQRLLDLSTLNDSRKQNEHKVTFHEERRGIFSEYLSVFDLSDPNSHIVLKKDIPEHKLFRVSEQIFKSFILTKRQDTDDFKEHMLKSRIHTLDLIKLALNYWINRSLDINVNLEEEMQNLSKILHLICLTTTTENICVEYNKTSSFWTKIREYLADSPKPFPALTAAMLCRSVAQRIEQEKEAQQCSATSLEEETSTDIWEKLSQENCQWTLLIGKLEDVSLLNIILSNKPICDNSPLPKLYYEPIIISLKYILQKGKGAVSELVAQWLSSGGIGPEFILVNELCNIPNKVESEASSRPESVEYISPPNPSVLQKNLNVNQPVFDHLNILKKQFPYSLDSSAILANMCWEYALTWQKDIQNVSYLDAMTKCLQHISNLYMKQGLFNLVWTTHLKQTFESACKLINKVGKVPKEILCRQDTGLTDLQLPIFIEFCTNFLDLFMDTLQQCYGSERITLHFENLWENGGNPLTELALQQSEINDSLLHVHYQLSLIVQIITTFGIKQIKPVQSLFDSATINIFFTDLSQNTQISTHSSESKLLKTRTQFLLKVINASIETVRNTDEGIYSQDHVNWMSKCVSLASFWGIDTDLLRRHQVLLLYTNGFNDLADEILPSVGNTEALGCDLITIAGKQLKKLLMSSEDLTAKVVALSPSLSQYLETLDTNWCAPGSIVSIIRIAEHSVRYLPEANSFSRQASLLLDACLTLQGMEN